MKGLLDFASTPAGQGLLAAAFGGLAGARRGQPINSIGRAGLAGLAGHSTPNTAWNPGNRVWLGSSARAGGMGFASLATQRE